MISTYKKRPDGSIYINPPKRHVRAYTIQAEDNPVVTVPANGRATARFAIDTQGHFEWLKTVFRATSDEVLINIFDEGRRRDLMNEPCHLATIAGDAQRPFLLPESYFLNTENGPRSIMVEFEDLSGAENNVELALLGRRWYHSESPPEVQREMRDFFQKRERNNVYWLTPQNDVTLPANGRLEGQQAPLLVATNEADTEIFKFMVHPVNAQFEFQIRELRSNRALSSGFVDGRNGFGDGRFPYILPESLLLERNYELRIDLRDISGTEQNLFFTAATRRLYYAGN